MPITVHIHNAQKRYPKRICNRITRRIAAAETAMETLHRLPRIDLTVFLTLSAIHPDYTMTGRMYERDSMAMWINPDHADFEEKADEEIFTMTIHETHHCLRGAHTDGEYNLADALVLEGMALAAEKQLGCPQTTWEADRPSKRVLTNRLRRAAADPVTKEYSWVYKPPRGQRLNVIYYVGEAIVDSWLAETGETAFTALDVNAMKVIRESPALRSLWPVEPKVCVRAAPRWQANCFSINHTRELLRIRKSRPKVRLG